MKNKKKKGFTLIELLAIIVILAIIAVITVPIILNIIENSRRGAASDSAYGFKDAVQKAYVTELSKPDKQNLKLQGEYTVLNGVLNGTGFSNVEIPVSGTKPSSGSLTYENNVLISGCLVIGDYAVTFNGNETSTEKGTCSSSSEQGSTAPTQPIVKLYESDGVTPKSKENMAVGDMAKIDDQGFEVINTNNNGNVVLLAEYNLKEQTVSNNTAYNESNNGIMLMSNRTYLADNDMVWKQYNGAYNANVLYFITSFSNSNYWYGVNGQHEECDEVEVCTASASASASSSGESSCQFKTQCNYVDEYGYIQNYDTDSSGYRYIYRTSTGEDTNNNINPILNAYKTYLQSLGQNIADVRLMSYAEANSLRNAQRLANHQYYWLGSGDSDGVVWVVSPHGDLYYDIYNSFNYGVRPVIEISTSEF